MEHEVGGKLFKGTNYYNISFCLPHLSRNPSRKRFEKNSTQMVYLTMCLTSIKLFPSKSPRLRLTKRRWQAPIGRVLLTQVGGVVVCDCDW